MADERNGLGAYEGSAEHEAEEIYVNMDELVDRVARSVSAKIESAMRRNDPAAQKTKKTKKLLWNYRRLKTIEAEQSEMFSDEEMIQKRWEFMRDLMGGVSMSRLDSVGAVEEKRRAENQWYIARIEYAVDQYKKECEAAGSAAAMRRYRGFSSYYIDGERKKYTDIADTEGVSRRTVINDINEAVNIISVYIFGV